MSADRELADRTSADREPAAGFVAARGVGRRVAQASWLAVWLGLAFLAVLPASRAPRAIGAMITRTAPGEPAWLAWIDTHAATVLNRHGLLASILLAAVLVVIALGTYQPPRAARAAIVLALAVAAALWLAEGLGGILTGSGTDPSTGPLLALLALAFWPAAPAKAPAPANAAEPANAADPANAAEPAAPANAAPANAAEPSKPAPPGAASPEAA